MKLYARQINPEYQESPMYWNMDNPEGTWLEGLAICGNRDFNGMRPELFKRVEKVLESGELADEIEDIQSGRGWYKNITEAINNMYLWPEKSRKAYNTREIHALKELVMHYPDCKNSEDNDIYCKVLSIVSGKTWNWKTICGVCQRDWNEIFYDDSWTDKGIEVIEAEYFNTGSEWIIHNADNEPETAEDIDGYSMYCHGWNEDQIRQEIAENEGVKPEDVVLYVYDGYTRTEKYRIA